MTYSRDGGLHRNTGRRRGHRQDTGTKRCLRQRTTPQLPKGVRLFDNESNRNKTTRLLPKHVRLFENEWDSNESNRNKLMRLLLVRRLFDNK